MYKPKMKKVNFDDGSSQFTFESSSSSESSSGETEMEDIMLETRL